MLREKECRDCGSIFQPKGPAGLYCQECRAVRYQELKKRRREAAYKKFCEKQVALGRGHVIGLGRGGNNKKGKDHPWYANGNGTFPKLSREMKDELEECQVCGKDLTDATRFEWCVHHIDRERTNNTLSNLILLCKRCHQVEHRCWEAFEGATTIPQGSTSQANGDGSAEPPKECGHEYVTVVELGKEPRLKCILCGVMI
jgi:hypothetical protein